MKEVTKEMTLSDIMEIKNILHEAVEPNVKYDIINVHN